jgi:hypothetical protein
MTAILARAEWPDPTFDAAALAGWPTSARDELLALGVLTPAERARTAVCDACADDHVELVRWERHPDRPPRAYISCREFKVVWLDPKDLDRWSIRLPVLAREVARAVGAASGVVERVPGRVWKLGTVRVGGRVWVGLLAVGLTRSDAAAVVEAVPELRAVNALVFVPVTVPAESVWSADRAPVVVPLCDVLTVGGKAVIADRDALASAVTPTARPAPKGPARVFPIPPGTTWKQVSLVVEEHHVRIQVGAVVERFGFAEAGFEDRREKSTPDEVWTLLGLLARFRGVLGTDDDILTKAGKLKQKVTTLRNRLRALLALDDDPFHPTRKNQPYRARFAIRSAGLATFPTPPGATWGDVSITETAMGVVEVAVTAGGRDVAFVRGDDQADRGRWEGTIKAEERHNRYTLGDLGLIGSDGTVMPAGEVLVAVLRAGGRINRLRDDGGLTTLSGTLTRFFQLDGPPFAFDGKRRVWIAHFEAASVVPASDR